VVGSVKHPVAEKVN